MIVKRPIVIGRASISGLILLGGLVIANAMPGQALAQQAQGQTGAEVYKNLKMEMFRGMPAPRVERVMQVVSTVLGVECTHCHEQDNWAKDELNEDQVHAREMMGKMFGMIRAITVDHFDGSRKGPTCWTCHRGSTEPSRFPPKELKPAATPEPSPFVMEDIPSSEAYMNIQILKGLPAERLPQIMNMMSVALGVKCSSCHVEGDWASDEKEMKQTARKMFSMRTAVLDNHFESDYGKIFCWTCHRGSTEPEKNPPM